MVDQASQQTTCAKTNSDMPPAPSCFFSVAALVAEVLAAEVVVVEVVVAGAGAAEAVAAAAGARLNTNSES